MISERLKNVILNELKIPDFDMQDDTTADQVPKWDSLSHVNVIVAVEKEYNIKFKGIEILKIKNIGGLQQLVDKKLAAVS